VLTTQDMQARDLQRRFGSMSLKCKWDVSSNVMSARFEYNFDAMLMKF
jgi:hypothetical protein